MSRESGNGATDVPVVVPGQKPGLDSDEQGIHHPPFAKFPLGRKLRIVRMVTVTEPIL